MVNYYGGLFGVILGVTVNTQIGVFDDADNELAKVFVNYLDACRMLSHAQPRCAARRMPHAVLPSECVHDVRSMLAIACVRAIYLRSR